jgi:transposase
MSIRALAIRHHVSRRTVGKALQSEIPPPRKKLERQPTVLLGLREHIDAMLKTDPRITAAAIWQQSAGD